MNMEEKIITIDFTMQELLLLQIAVSLVTPFEDAKEKGEELTQLGLHGAIINHLLKEVSTKQINEKIHTALCIDSLKSNLHI